MFYHEWAAPLLDPAPGGRGALDSYLSLPKLQGRPEPILGIAEAWDMIEDFRDSMENPKVVIIWTAVAKPRTPVNVGLNLLEKSGIDYTLMVSKSSLPGWARHAGIGEDKVLLYRPHTNVSKLVSRIAHS